MRNSQDAFKVHRDEHSDVIDEGADTFDEEVRLVRLFGICYYGCATRCSSAPLAADDL